MKEMLRKFFVNQNQDELENFLTNNNQPQGGVLVLVLALYNKVVTSIGGEDLEEETRQTLLRTVQKFTEIPLAPIFRVKNLTGLSQRNSDLLKIAFIAKTVSSLNDSPAGVSD